MRSVLTTAFELVGFGLLIAGASLVSLAAGLFVAGAVLVAIGVFVGRA